MMSLGVGLGGETSTFGGLSANQTQPMGGLPQFGQSPGGATGIINSNSQGNLLVFDNPNLDIKLNQQLGHWMTWCQTCKHGGHA